MAQQTTALVAVPEEVAKQQSRVILQAQAIRLEDPDDYEASTHFLKMLDDASVLADKLFDDNIGRWHAGHKAAVAQKKNFVSPFERAMQIVKIKRQEFRSVMEQRRLQAERELREKAEAEQKQQLEAEAQTLEAAGDPKAAEAVREFAEQAPAPVVVVPDLLPRAGSGTAVRKHWKFRIVNAALIPPQYLIPDEKAIGAHGRSLQDKASIPGVEFYADESEAVL